MDKNIVSINEWRKERLLLLKREKEFTKLRDKLSKKRRALPWVRITKDYTFQTNDGPAALPDLFASNSQLIVYHYMFGPDYEVGCKSCSFWADLFNPAVPHLNQRDVTLICISRGPLEKIEAFKKRMDWSFNWVSSLNSDFNFDFQVSFLAEEESEYNYQKMTPDKDRELPGFSVFYKDQEGTIFYTYSCYSRELETYNTVYRLLDMVPKGRNEDQLPWPMAWVDFHDQY